MVSIKHASKLEILLKTLTTNDIIIINIRYTLSDKHKIFQKQSKQRQFNYVYFYICFINYN